MGIFSKANNVVKEAPVFRLFNSGFSTLGAQVRAKDTRTTEQLWATIDYFAQRNPAVQAFVKELKTMEPKHLGLVADTLELASREDMLMTNINMNKVSQETGKSLLQHLLSIFPKASKENPKSLELAQEVIDNTDSITAKYFLADCFGYFQAPQAAEHLAAIKPLIKPFAEQTLAGGYLGTFEKQANFTNLIKGLVTSQADPKKIALIPDVCKAIDKVPEADCYVSLNTIANSSTPIKQVKENIEVLPKVLENLPNKEKPFDVAGFINNNVNLY